MTAARKIAIASLLLGLVAGCRWPWEPESVLIQGTVRNRDGSRAVRAKVELGDRNWVLTDWAGRYSLNSSSAPGDTITVDASDLWGEMCGETHAGYATVTLRKSSMIVNLVLNHAIPI